MLMKDLPLSYILLFPFYTSWRYIIQVYGLLSGKGSVARFAEGGGASRLIRVVIRAYAGALAGLPRMLLRRKTVWHAKRLTAAEFRNILKRHRITAKELMLRD